MSNDLSIIARPRHYSSRQAARMVFEVLKNPQSMNLGGVYLVSTIVLMGIMANAKIHVIDVRTAVPKHFAKVST